MTRQSDRHSGPSGPLGWQTRPVSPKAGDRVLAAEAALGEAEEKLRQIRRLLAFYNSNDPEFRERHERYFLRALGETEIRREWLS